MCILEAISFALNLISGANFNSRNCLMFNPNKALQGYQVAGRAFGMHNRTLIWSLRAHFGGLHCFQQSFLDLSGGAGWRHYESQDKLMRKTVSENYRAVRHAQDFYINIKPN
jgi:hypothetical protein